MATYSIHRTSHEAVDASLVETQDVRQLFAIAVPRVEATVERQVTDTLDAVAILLRNANMLGGLIQQTIFLADFAEVDHCRRIVRSFYGGDLPVTSFVPQRPCNGKLLAIEMWGVEPQKGTVEIERLGGEVVIARGGGLRWVCVADSVPRKAVVGVYNQVTRAFQQLHQRLLIAGTRFDQTIRTWFYVGGILEREGAAGRYEQLNSARANLYRDVPFFTHDLPRRRGSAYPASTAIGTEGNGISVSVLALAADRPDVVVLPLENPQQQAACDYAQGDDFSRPMFSRGVVVAAGRQATTFISGTASITESEARHADDAVAQTTQTLDNMAALISEDNLRRHGLTGFGTTLEGLASMRVYLKQQKDYERVRNICEYRAPRTPSVYTVADVCRPELLVEIEGVAVSSRAVSS